ncbi:MAG: transcriptional repressor [Burkholderiaceae bacterium]
MNKTTRDPAPRKIDDEPAKAGRHAPPPGARAAAYPRLRFRASQAQIWALLASLGPVDLSRERILGHLRAHDPTLPSASVDGIINGMEHKGLLTRRIMSDELILYRIKPFDDASRSASPPPRTPSRREAPRTRRSAHTTERILAALADAGDTPLSRSDIHRRLAREGSTMSLSTVYRAMGSLERKGLVLTEWGADREARYRIKPTGFDAQTLFVCCDSTGRRVEIRDRALLGRLITLAHEHGIDTAGKTISVVFSD